MRISKYSFLLIATVPIVLALASSGCATKKYARTQAGIVNDRVSQIQTETNAQIAALASKEQTDISRVEERIATTDNKLASVSTTANQANTTAGQANTTASQALQQGQANSAQITSNSAELAKLDAAQNYTLLESGNVMFQVNRSEISDEGKVGLDLMIQKAAGASRPTFEIVGFTDKTGSKNYNLVLSQKRAEAVARYLVRQNVAVKNISLIGLGEEQTPEQLAAEVQALDPNASNKDLKALARRVRVRLYVPSSPGTQASQ
jgi:outer membrane protein OmpA-like peptidoglycan-associated protein